VAASQYSDAEQVSVTVEPVPVELQVRTSLPSQNDAPGVQTLSVQAPPKQCMPVAAQSTDETMLNPSLAQVSSTSPSQAVVPGSQSREVQEADPPVLLHVVPEAHGTGVPHAAPEAAQVTSALASHFVAPASHTSSSQAPAEQW